MSMYVPMVLKQRSVIMNKGDLVINDYDTEESEFYSLPRDTQDVMGIVVGFSCGGRRYQGMYEALDSPESIRDVVKVDVMWSTGIVTEELAPCLMVVSRADW